MSSSFFVTSFGVLRRRRQTNGACQLEATLVNVGWGLGRSVLLPVELLRNLSLLVVRQRREHLTHVTVDHVLNGEVRRTVGQLVPPAQRGALLPKVHLQVREEIDCKRARGVSMQRRTKARDCVARGQRLRCAPSSRDVNGTNAPIAPSIVV